MTKVSVILTPSQVTDPALTSFQTSAKETQNKTPTDKQRSGLVFFKKVDLLLAKKTDL